MPEDGITKPTASSALLPGEQVSCGQLAVLVFAVFLKGGLLGAYVSFSALWLSRKGFSNQDLGMVAVVDATFSLLLPMIGGLLDKLRSHNLGFSVLLTVLTVLKLCYLPAAKSLVGILVLTALTAPLLRASNSILDALALYAFAERGHFGRVRLFGDLGFGFIALGVGAGYHAIGNEDLIFWSFAAICFTLAVFWAAVSRYMANIRPDSKAMTRQEFLVQLRFLRRQLWTAPMGRALFCLWLGGSSLGLIATFEFVLLEQLTASGTLLGVCKLVGTLGALPVWWYTPALMDQIGLSNVQLIGLAGAAFRLLVLATIHEPWHALFSEALAGLGGFALFYTSITVFVGRTTDEEMKGTAQTVIFVVFTGLGAGGSALLGGYLAEVYGIQGMFRMVGSTIAGVTCAMVVLDALALLYRGLEDNSAWKLRATPREDLCKTPQ